MQDGNEAITRFGQRRAPAGGARQLRSSVLSQPGPRATPPRPTPSRPPPRQPARQPIDLDHMYGGYGLSAAWHAALFLLVIFGIPNLFHRSIPEAMPIAVKLVNEAELTRATQRNPHPVKEAKIDTPPPEEPAPEPTPPVPQEEPPAPAPPPPSAAAHTPEPEPKPEVAPPKPAPTPPPPPPTPEPKPAPPPPPPEPQPKPEPPKPVAKEEPPKPQQKPDEDKQFDQLLKNLTREQPVAAKSDKPAKPQKPKPAAQMASAQPDAPLGAQLTTSERDMLIQQIEQCWNFDPGAKGAEDLKVEIHIDVDQSGTIIDSQIVDRSRLATDPVWRAAAESAYRATLAPACHTLKVPADKYQTWKSINLIFDPKDLQ